MTWHEIPKFYIECATSCSRYPDLFIDTCKMSILTFVLLLILNQHSFHVQFVQCECRFSLKKWQKRSNKKPQGFFLKKFDFLESVIMLTRYL